MPRIIYAALGGGDVHAGLIKRLGYMPIDLAANESRIDTLRAAVQQAMTGSHAFMLAVDPNLVPRGDHQVEVILPLRRAFGLLTGAALSLRARGGGTIVMLLPEAALMPSDLPLYTQVLLRALVGLGEALRAEVLESGVGVTLAFYATERESEEVLAARLASVLPSTPLYSLAPGFARDTINTYFASMIEALGATSAGPPLPDIGPMAAVYDLVAAKAPSPR